jgi:hypothetical protein
VTARYGRWGDAEHEVHPGGRDRRPGHRLRRLHGARPELPADRRPALHTEGVRL